MDWIEVPVDHSAIVEILIAEQIEAMLADLFCLLDDLFGLSGEPLAQERQQGIDGIWTEEKISPLRNRRILRASGKIESQARQHAIRPLAELLPNTIAQFFVIHSLQSSFHSPPVFKLHMIAAAERPVFSSRLQPPYLNCVPALQVDPEKRREISFTLLGRNLGCTTTASYIIDLLGGFFLERLALRYND
jgi:hypothetical protein